MKRALLEREQNIEELRRTALALRAANEQLIAMLQQKCKELEALKGSEGELQMTLALVLPSRLVNGVRIQVADGHRMDVRWRTAA